MEGTPQGVLSPLVAPVMSNLVPRRDVPRSRCSPNNNGRTVPSLKIPLPITWCVLKVFCVVCSACIGDSYLPGNNGTAQSHARECCSRELLLPHQSSVAAVLRDHKAPPACLVAFLHLSCPLSLSLTLLFSTVRRALSSQKW